MSHQNWYGITQWVKHLADMTPVQDQHQSEAVDEFFFSKNIPFADITVNKNVFSVSLNKYML